MKNKFEIAVGAAIGATVISLGLGVYNGWQNVRLARSLADLKQTFANLENNFASTTVALSETRGTLDQTRNNFDSLETKLTRYRKEVGSVSDTVETLEKLSQTDPELLQKYSKIFFLNEHYAPARLSAIPPEYSYSENKTLKFEAQAWPFLKKLLEAAAKDGIKLYVYSAFRSFDEQGALKGIYAVTYGAGTANQFSADQGYSEHQLGTTVDLITTGLKGQLDGFEKTAAYDWLNANAYRWGFVLSYPKNNSYYVFEPWHWRFVGQELATDLHQDGKNFYDLDQREIDKYLVSIFD